MPATITEYANAVARFDEHRRREFYEVLALNLTISARGVWSDDTLTDAEKVEQLKGLNEIQHRVIGKLRAKGSWPDADFLAAILETPIGKHVSIAGHVGWAVKDSFKHATSDSTGE